MMYELSSDCLISNPRNCFAVLAPNSLSFRPPKTTTAPTQPEFIPLTDIKTVNRVNVRKFRRNPAQSGGVSLLKTQPGSLVVKMGESGSILQRTDDVRCYLRKKTGQGVKRPATESLPGATAKTAEASTATKRLFVVQNGDLKPILSSNIANSGVFRPSEPRHTTLPDCEPRNIIIADTIRGGIMTPQHYEEELRRVKPVPQAPRRILYRVIRPGDVNLGGGEEALAGPVATRGRVGRRKGTLKKPPSIQVSAEEEPVPTARTRSGRLTRPPRHIHLDYRGNQVIMRPAPAAEAEP
ncbi:uncharacterized protein LOC129807811, partial [Phlebotomus papatasi]|uniref:uncharacterized protein LOC129807811 n=1 Tax=Phlebotomus papatasi TaxID=29031 RepID=UPI00248437CE